MFKTHFILISLQKHLLIHVLLHIYIYMYIQGLRNTRHRACLRMGVAISVLIRFGYRFENMGLKRDRSTSKEEDSRRKWGTHKEDMQLVLPRTYSHTCARWQRVCQERARGDLKILLRLAKKAPAHARNCFGHYDIERTEKVENGVLEGSKIEVNWTLKVSWALLEHFFGYRASFAWKF